MPILLPTMRNGRSNIGGTPELAVWNGQVDRTGLVPQSAQAVITNLVGLDMVQPAGVSMVLAPAKAFEWRLAAGDGGSAYTQALTELRLLLLAQHLGLVESETYSLDRPSLLARVLRTEVAAGEIRVWRPKSTTNRDLPRIIAGIVKPTYPLFPSAAVQSADGRMALANWVVNESDGRAIRTEAGVRLGDIESARRFRARVLEMRQDSTLVDPSGPWYQALERCSTP